MTLEPNSSRRPQDSTGALAELHEWANAHPHSVAALQIPDEFLGLLIPPRVVELCHRPSHLAICENLKRSMGELEIIVLERDSPETLTEEAVWKEYLERRAKRLSQSGASNLIAVPRPDRVSIMHYQLTEHIESGLISIQDRPFLRLYLGHGGIDHGDTVKVWRYDGETGKGIATEFYTETLPPFLRSLGFRYLVGENYERNEEGPNIDFFCGKLGRVNFMELSEEDRRRISKEPQLEQMRQKMTVQFLD